jgi:hypothetical protein
MGNNFHVPHSRFPTPHSRCSLEEEMNYLLRHKLVIGVTFSAIVVALLIAVGGSKSKGKAPAGAPPPANVEVAQVESQNVPIYSEWIGTLDGTGW